MISESALVGVATGPRLLHIKIGELSKTQMCLGTVKMSIAYEFTPDKQREWNEWVEALPETTGNLARKFPINRLYILLSSFHIVSPYSYGDNGTLTVTVSKEYNDITESWRVFGVLPDGLLEWNGGTPFDVS